MMPVIVTVTVFRREAGSAMVAPTFTFRRDAVSSVTTPWTAPDFSVTSAGVAGQAPATRVACSSSPDWAAYESLGGTASGRGSHGSVATTALVVRTPYATDEVFGAQRGGKGLEQLAADPGQFVAPRRGLPLLLRQFETGLRPGDLHDATARGAVVMSWRSPFVSYASTARGNAAARNAVTSTSTARADAAPGAVRSRVLIQGPRRPACRRSCQ